MTTTVRVEAHCGPDKEVLITDEQGKTAAMQDGEVRDFYVYDGRSVTVEEVAKPTGTGTI